MKRTHVFLMVVTAFLLVAAVALPLAAQTATPDPDSLVLVIGPVDLSSGDIVVADYIIAPAGAFTPSVLHQGDVVIITGYLLPDGITVQALTFEFFVEPEVTPEVTLEVTPEVTLEVTPEVTATPEACNFPNHPVALRIAEAFDVSYEEVIAQHCAGFGFGEITRAYLIAAQTGEDVQTYFDMRGGGQGWGQIVRETGIHPSQLAPGQVHRGGYNTEATDEAGEALEAETDDRPGNSGGGGRPDCPGNSCNAPGHGGGGGRP